MFLIVNWFSCTFRRILLIFYCHFLSIAVCKTDRQCNILQCNHNRHDNSRYNIVRNRLAFGILIRTIILVEHFFMNHILNAHHPDCSKLHLCYLCYTELIDLIRTTVWQALWNRTIEHTHVIDANGRTWTYTTAYMATYSESVGSFVSRHATTYLGVPVPVRVYQYSCKVIFSDGHFFNHRGCKLITECIICCTKRRDYYCPGNLQLNLKYTTTQLMIY